MIGAQAAIAQGFQAYQRGDLAAARSALQGVQHPHAWHLLGLIERKAGQFSLALDWLAKAETADRRNPEIANNQGRVALDAGQVIDAEKYFRRALSLRSDWEPALTGLGKTLTAQKRWQEARQVWNQVLKQKPQDVSGHYNAAMADVELGQLDQAEAAFSSLIDAGVDDAAVWFMRGRARCEASQIDQGIADLEMAWVKRPEAHVLKNLANTLWMSGQTDRFHHLLSNVPEPLAVMAVDLRGQSGDLRQALEDWAQLSETQQNQAEALAIKSVLHRDLKEIDAAYEAGEAALKISPNSPFVIDAAACGRLMVGDGEGALEIIKPLRLAQPNSQHWLAYETTALRVMGDPRYDHLVQLDQHVRAYELPVPEGFETIQSFNDAFLEALEPVRGFTTHPLDQSLRLGQQTSRDLVTTPDPVIQAYIKALDQPIRAFMKDMGKAPDHPLTARNSGEYAFNGCWSVKLIGGGRHVNHIHSEGWISSAYYASVPAETRSGDSKSGWIKFAEPPFQTQPETPPQKWIQPEAGLLVLFPSYLWHGTEPINGTSERVTAPFDVVPI
ncbi:MAG: putative 2OG-Fe(II) oxygenase [Pseudomonadota bacterium]